MITILENYPDRAEAFQETLSLIGQASSVYRPHQGDQPPTELPSHLILTGGSPSAWEIMAEPYYAPALELIKVCLEGDIPTLGVCLGHQVLATILGGRVERRHQRVGWYEVAVGDDPLFGGCYRSFPAFHYHQDEVVELPSEAVQIATSDHCQYESFRLHGSPVWGVQFHPEMSLERGNDIFVKTNHEVDSPFSLGKSRLALMRNFCLL